MLEFKGLHVAWPFMLWSYSVVLPVAIFLIWRRRNITALWWIFGICILLFALCRPQASILRLEQDQSLILILDVSGSMRANDVLPSRIEAAQEIASLFIDKKAVNAKLGLILAAGSAALVQPPTHDKEALRNALHNPPLQAGSALGAGVALALKHLTKDASIDWTAVIRGQNLDLQKITPSSAAPHAALVLISDGQGNTGPTLIDIARLARAMEMRIYTVGIGTAKGAILKSEGYQSRVTMDETVLREVATLSGGEYFSVVNAENVRQTYERLRMRLISKSMRLTELTAFIASFGALLLMAIGALNWWKTGRII
jgi:Ca-activated chloride channel family protein